MRFRHSAGIICVRYDPETRRPEVLMVCKRYTYAFFDFVCRRWGTNDKFARVRELLDKMTIEEKLDLLSLNFDRLWYRVWLGKYVKSPNFIHMKCQFESNFLIDDGVRLRDLISRSKSVAAGIWEIPKGRGNYREAELSTAIREFTEETNVSRKLYRLVSGVTRQSKHVDENVTYVSKYYAAIADTMFEPRVIIGSITEIGDCRWMNMDAVKTMCPGQLDIILPVLRALRAVRRTRFIGSAHFGSSAPRDAGASLVRPNLGTLCPRAPEPRTCE